MLSFKPFLDDIEDLRDREKPELEISRRVREKSDSLRPQMTADDYARLFREAGERFAARTPFERLGIYYECLNRIRDVSPKADHPERLQKLFEIGYWFMKPMRDERLFAYFKDAFNLFESTLIHNGDIDTAERDIESLFEKAVAKVRAERPDLYPQDY